MKVINLTPHDVNICDELGNIIMCYPKSGKVARIDHDYKTFARLGDVPVVRRVDEEVINLPKPQKDVMYIVSNVLMNHCSDRLDLLAPVQQVKVNGKVVGCQAFMSNR